MVANGTPAIPPKSSGGLELVIYYLAKWLSYLGQNVTVIDTESDEERDLNADLSFCRVTRIRHPSFARFHRRRTGYFTHELLRQFSMLSFAGKLIVCQMKILSTRKYDIIHTHYRYPFFAAWLVKKILRIDTPLIYHCHNAWLMKERIPFLLRLFWFPEMIAVKTADKVVAVSNSLKHSLVNVYHVSAEKVVVIPNGVELPPLESSIRSPTSDVNILCVANVYELKNQKVLIEALPEVKKQFPSIKLLLVGEIVDEKYHHWLRQRIKELNLSENVSFLGGVNHREISGILDKADVAVLPSKFEAGLSMAALEYLASAKPTLLSRIPSFTMTVNESVALFFDPNNASELSSILLDVLNNKTLRKELSSRGREFVASRYSWSVVGKKVEELYATLIQSKIVDGVLIE
jgi:glycosyltransferase involved in cell wall biosynthesis